jgi:putative aminopeptidase FrvX
VQKRKLLSITRAILAQPTAPFHEEQVAAEILRQLEKCENVRVQRDQFGNLIARYQRSRRGKKSRRARYAFAAHMDHPAWVAADETAPPRAAKKEKSPVLRLRGSPPMRFFGGVPASYLRKPRVKSFGEFAMWDLPAFELRDGCIHSRACDDLIGCAVIVAMFHELEKMRAECACVGIFSRAEEIGFAGAMKLAQSGALSKTLTVISLETSAERPPAKIGDGPIVRVGDRTSIFDSAATAEITGIAKREKIRVQRCLMPGGTCEATAYQLYGYRSAALCVALGNYHNCGPNEKIAAEFVSLADVQGLVRLSAQIAAEPKAQAGVETALRKRLEKNLANYARYF